MTSPREAAYTSQDKKIRFCPNPRDGPDAYDVTVGERDALYIPDRVLEELTDPRTTPDHMLEMLNNISGGQAGFILKEHGITAQRFYTELLHLRIQSLTSERDDALLEK